MCHNSDEHHEEQQNFHFHFGETQKTSRSDYYKGRYGCGDLCVSALLYKASGRKTTTSGSIYWCHLLFEKCLFVAMRVYGNLCKSDKCRNQLSLSTCSYRSAFSSITKTSNLLLSLFSLNKFLVNYSKLLGKPSGPLTPKYQEFL